MRLYVSGPITGLPDLNKPVFELVTKALEQVGHDVVNPHLVCTILGQHDCKGPCTPSEAMLPWSDYLRADLIAMLQECDSVATLPKWEHSRGANLEVHVARALGWQVKPWVEWLNP